MGKGFAKKNQLVVAYGAMVQGSEVGLPTFSALLEFVAAKGDATVSGYIHPTVGANGDISIQWMGTVASASKGEAKAIIMECYRSHSRAAAKKIKGLIEQADCLIVA